MEKILVADIMTKDPITAKPETNLLECAKKMIKKRVGSLILLDKKTLVGIITQRDILWALMKKSKEDLSKIKAIDISPKKLLIIKTTSTIEEAINKMKKKKIERLPVMNGKDFVGIVTVRDILSFHPQYYPELEEFSKIREESKKLKRIKSRDRKIHSEGICGECGEYTFLYKVDGRLVCASCRSFV